jgi:CDP-6-deoxy-D-xylo-4-hexulose-3-dehydrase
VTPSILLGHEIIVLDVNPRTLGIDAETAIAVIESGAIDVLFVTHLLGFDALTDEVLLAAKTHGVTILEDVCESHGAAHGSAKVGTYGLASSFSFYYGHHMSTIEGGMVSTSDPAFADELRMLREHGLARASRTPEHFENEHPGIDPRFLFVSPGLNFRSSDLNAFIGLGQLESLDERIDRRNENLDTFLENAPEGVWTDYRTAGVSSFALPLIAEDAPTTLAVKRAVDSLGIENRPVVAGNLLRQPFMAEVEAANGATPVADHVHDHGLYVGNGHHVTADMVEQLTDTIRQEINQT